jgi:hypothetical protein
MEHEPAEPKFIDILRELKQAMERCQSQLRHGVALLDETSMQRHKVSSHPFPTPSLYIIKRFSKSADRHQCVQPPIPEIFPTLPLSLCSGVGS